MAEKFTKKQRQNCEERVYRVMDILDPSGTNSEYYKKLFSKLSDAQFYSLMKQKFPYKFHVTPMVVEPSIKVCDTALKKELKSKLFEKVHLNYFYTNSKGESVDTAEALVGYAHLPKVQQMIVKKNKNAIDINNRDMKTGRLNSDDKGAVTSDRELESMKTLGFDYSVKEFAGFRADAMNAKNIGYNQIMNTGILSIDDIPDDPGDVLSKQLMNVYMIGAHINSNIVNTGNYTEYTLKMRSGGISRDSN